jgi:hypothetical protein
MLRLLAQREQGYEDMAALMGVSVEELRGRVKEALSELEKEGEEAPSLPPEPQADAAKATPETPKAKPPASEAAKPESEAAKPAISPPSAAGEPPELSATPPAGQATPPKRPKRGISLPASKGARIGAAAVAAAIVVVVVLLLVLGGGDGSDSTTGTTTVNNTEGPGGNANAVAKVIKSTEGAPGGREVTRAILDGSDGEEAQGVVVFGRLQNKLALYIVAEDLEPAPQGESYVVWIAQSPSKMLPLPISPVVENGKIAERVQVPAELLAYLADGTFHELAITRASVAKLNTALNQATKDKKEVAYTGTPVMRGEITGPIVGAAKRLEEEEKAGGK